jgi:hypothetical protein
MSFDAYCLVHFPDDRDAVRLVRGSLKLHTVVTFQDEPGIWFAEDVTLDGYANEEIDGKPVHAEITVRPATEEEIASQARDGI